jgi:polar amino acid transport system substrate-binding protein
MNAKQAPTGRRYRLGLVVVPVVALLSGCLSAPQLPTTDSSSTSTTPAIAASAAPCSDPNGLASYRPSNGGKTVAALRARQYIVVGVSADTQQLGAVDPADPKTFQGFDIDLARGISKDLFGTDDAAHLRFKVITAAQRVDQLIGGLDDKGLPTSGVDLVVRAFTINCDRWKKIAFSQPYFTANLKLLVLSNIKAKVVSLDSLAAQYPKAPAKVCGPAGSTSLKPLEGRTDLEAVQAPNHTDCLVMMRQAKADAIIGDDVILAGLAAQDPNVAVIDQSVGDAQPYGIGVNAKQPDLVEYVNGVLDKMSSDAAWQQKNGASWQKSYDHWLLGLLKSATPPSQPTIYRAG